VREEANQGLGGGYFTAQGKLRISKFKEKVPLLVTLGGEGTRKAVKKGKGGRWSGVENRDEVYWSPRGTPNKGFLIIRKGKKEGVPLKARKKIHADEGKKSSKGRRED